MQSNNRRRFRSHVVNRGLRLRLVWDDVLFALIAALASIGILYFLSNREIGDSMWSAHFSIKETKELLDKGVIVAGIVTFFAVLAFGIWSLIDAHRIAGPMHRLKNLLDDVATGNLTHEIQFRKNDEFQDIATSADALVESFSAKITKLNALTDSLESAVDPKSAELVALVANLRAELSSFQLAETPQ